MPCSACGQNGKNASGTKPSAMILNTTRKVVRTVRRPRVFQRNIQPSIGKKTFFLGHR